MKKLAFAFTLLLAAVNLFAQRPAGMPQAGAGNAPKGMSITGRVYGKVIDEATKKPVEFASVVALRPLGRRDSIVGGMLTLDNGEFSIDNLPIGGIKIKISLIGYKDVVKQVNLFPPDLELDLGDLKLGIDAKVLQEVEVTGTKTSMQLALDKKVFNVDKNITTTGGTAEDVLKSVPSVTVDADGSAKLRNSSTTIYVDGKPTLMSINQIPADQIESVEVITNPSAKFEAATSGGIINIVLKKNRKPGYNGFIGLGAGTGNRYNAMLNLNVKEGRSNFTGFYNFNMQGNPVDGYSNRTELSANAPYKYFNQTSATEFNNKFNIGRLQWEYDVTNRNRISLAGMYINGKFNINSDLNYEFLDASNKQILRGVRTQQPRNEFTNYVAQATWKKSYAKKGKELVTDFMYAQGGSANDASWTTTKLLAGSTSDNKPEKVNITGENQGKQITFQIDYTNPINDSTKLEMGLRSFWNQRSQEYFYNLYDYNTSQYKLDSLFTQNFDVTDMINAAYITYGSKWKGIGYQIGMRYEQSNLKGTSKLANQPSFGYDYPKSVDDLFNALFPSVYLSKKLSKNEEIQANFSRKINRPNFMQLMPVIMGADPTTIRVGNAALTPEFINLAELNYNKMWKSNNWLISAYLRADENPITTVSLPLEGDSTKSKITFINGKSALRYGLDNTVKFLLMKDLELTTNFNLFNIKIQTETESNEGWSYNGKFNLTYKLPKKLKDFSLQLQGSYESDQIIPQGVRKGIAFADFAVKYTFMKVANVTFQISDITNTRREILSLNESWFTQESMRRRDTRFYKLSFQMPFGKMDSSVFRKAKDARRNNNNQQDMQPDFGGQ
ncbi:MAG: TonB-dependent receptor [Saprospiraceae bacterium]|nr:TonB-dependent receptor [Saprospiraceae bacterium]